MNKLFALLLVFLFFSNRADAQTTHIEAENWSSQSGVLTETCTDAGGGLDVGWIDNGDWMDYSYTAPSAGTYTIRLRVATPNSFAQLQIKLSGSTTVLSTVSVPTTGSFQTWQTVSTTLALAAGGTQTIRVQSSAAAGWNFNWLEIDAPSSGTNQPPTINAGVDQTITLPTSSVQLSGSASDPDAGGSIASISWTRVSGPTAYSFNSTSILNPSVSGLVGGVYVFRLTATDNLGLSSNDDITVTVNSAPSGWSLGGNTTAATDFIGTTNAQDLLFKAGNHSWARLKTDGTFEVNKLKVRADTWADYVFEPNYKLLPLKEVEAFIATHQHLPYVPSQKEVLREGVNVGESQAILLRKIEELTLYLINQNKQLEEQSREIQDLKKRVKALSKK